MATVVANPNFNAEVDAVGLHRAMKGMGTDCEAIITILSSINDEQRLKVVAEFQKKYGKDLIHELKSEMSVAGEFEDVIVALLTPMVLFEAKQMRRAVRGAGTDENTLIDILCSRPNREIRAISKEYKKHYDRDLIRDLQHDTSGNFGMFLTMLANGIRDEYMRANVDFAKETARELNEASNDKHGADVPTFIRVLCTNSHEQLRLVFDEYQKISGMPIEQTIESLKSEISSDLTQGMLALVQCAKCPASYFAKRLYECMKGAGTKDQALIRIIVCRSEVDLADIKKKFQAKYGQSLKQFVTDDTSLYYKDMLLALIK